LLQSWLSYSRKALKKKQQERQKPWQLSGQQSYYLEWHRSNGKVFMTAMKPYYEFYNWKSTKSTKDNRNIGPQTEAILLVFYDIPCFFSQTELEDFLGYVSPNHNVDGALIKTVEKEMLVNRIPVIAPISAPILGVHFFRERSSLKNGTICPLSGHDSSYFKNMCLLT
jgi:hypothetical protein